MRYLHGTSCPVIYYLVVRIRGLYDNQAKICEYCQLTTRSRPVRRALFFAFVFHPLIGDNPERYKPRNQKE